MKSLYLFIFFTILISCKKSNEYNQTYASEVEKSIIDKMSCWNNSESENIMNQIIKTDDKVKNDELYDKKFDLDEQVYNKGREVLKKDTIFINLIRNDSLLNDLKNQRNQLAKKILTFRKKVPFFDEYIENISKDIIEYNYYFVNEFGIYEYPPRNTEEIYLRDKTFYKNYTELLKESYKLEENSKIKDEYIIDLNKIIVSIEKIDMKLWCIKYYFEEKQKLEKEKLESQRTKKVDSLLQ
jgi:hypothetical protein